MRIEQQVGLEFCEINIQGEALVRGNLARKAVNVSPVQTFSIKVSMTSVRDDLIVHHQVDRVLQDGTGREDGVVRLIHDCETGYTGLQLRHLDYIKMKTFHQ